MALVRLQEYTKVNCIPKQHLRLLIYKLSLCMAAGHQFFTASEVGHLLTEHEDNDGEFLFLGSDDDFDTSLDVVYDPLEREQGK